MAKGTECPTLPTHGASTLPSVHVDSYNLELEDDDGFIGDKASKGAFRELLDKCREPLREAGADPLGDTPSDQISKRMLAEVLVSGAPEAAGVVQSAVEEFAQQLASVIRRFLKAKAWRGTEHIVVGGGFRASRLGELAVGRVSVILKADGIPVDIGLIRHPPDDAGLLGAAHLLPSWILSGHDGILAVDIGGTNIRAGLISLNIEKCEELSRAEVACSARWRHADETIKRDDAVDRLIGMLRDLIKDARKRRMRLAPVIGIGCPGVIGTDGFIQRGAQNLPGNWESSRFNLPGCIRREIPQIDDHETLVVMHNDAVVQGLSQLPFLRDRRKWGVITIGTGLGNAAFTNRVPKAKGKPAK